MKFGFARDLHEPFFGFLAQTNRPRLSALSCGGEGEIRTLGTREGSTVFETAAIDHSATSPALPV